MKKLIIGLVTIVSIFTMSNVSSAQTKDEIAAKMLITNYFNALNSSDANKITSLFTQNGVLLAQGAPTATGSEQVKGTYNYVFENLKFSLKVAIEDIIVKDNYAIISSTSSGSYVIKAKNETVATDYRETFILQKEKGTWHIARYMYNQSK